MGLGACKIKLQQLQKLGVFGQFLCDCLCHGGAANVAHADHQQLLYTAGFYSVIFSPLSPAS